MFRFIKDKIKSVYSNFTQKITSIFSGDRKLDDAFIEELRALLLASDTGVKTTTSIIERLKQEAKGVEDLEAVKKILESILITMLQSAQQEPVDPSVLLMVGINGSGKTTFVGKYAYRLKKQGKNVLLVAGDTFRAAATQQLQQWGVKVGVDVFVGKEHQDPASVIFDGCKKFHEEGYDHIIIDTAGRLQTKINLMKELEKIRKIINRQLPNASIAAWLTIDSMLGQNSLRQAEIFHEATNITGVVLTKMDGTGKGGIVFSIVDQFKLPIVFTTFGEHETDSAVFDAALYVEGLLNE